ncbi:hypothetical protein QVD17_00732 [Tagetes erecta]|uniref:EXPERA domain-containing protein n=1 Tax=Tagetes erecta TaxID=13708 RepID=A0AAD8L543_TARER|nr:hypothetical protein QVD17_00732 [Tagetes erecta]
MNIIDTVLFIYFLLISIAVPIIDAQVCLPSSIFPDILIHLKNWFMLEFGNYLISEKPHFYVGIAWLELILAWPISLASLYGIAFAKSWLPTTCLIYGLYFFTALVMSTVHADFGVVLNNVKRDMWENLLSQVAILSELIGSGKASKKLLIFYYTFMCFAVLAILRGIPYNSDAGKKPKNS